VTIETYMARAAAGPSVTSGRFDLHIDDNGAGELTFVILSPEGAPLYSFSDAREAEAEMALLNGPKVRRRRLRAATLNNSRGS
jgi:hypothetical protein